MSLYEYLTFLSHLSGDEALLNNLANKQKFLSHLSGDEVNLLLATINYLFLSHLSGDEGQKCYDDLGIDISKSPERGGRMRQERMVIINFSKSPERGGSG